MFKAARWRSEKSKIKAVFKFQFKATQVPGRGWEALAVAVVPADAGKPSARTEKAAVVDGAAQWLNPTYEATKLTQDQRSGKISDRVYQFVVSATGLGKSGVLGETSINLADYAEVFKPASVSLPLRDSNNGAILHVTIQRMQDDVEGRQTVETGEMPKETTENRSTNPKQQRITLKSQLSNPEPQDGDEAICAGNEEGSFTNSKALVKFHSSRHVPGHDELTGKLGKSNSFDAISASGSESSSGQYTPKEHGRKTNNSLTDNTSLLSPVSNSDTPRNADWSTGDGSIGGSANSSGETGIGGRLPGAANMLDKQKSDVDALARQLEVSDLELQTLRKQVVKESRRGQDILKELNTLKEERDALKKECEELKASKKRAADDEHIADPWSMLEEVKQELDHEKNMNANLRLQLQKTQEANSELIFAVRDLEELLEQKNTVDVSQETKPKNQVTHLRNLEVKQESETESDDKDDQYELDILVKEHGDIRVPDSQEKKIIELSSELELYRKDREDLEMQLEQLALDYEILKQENHDTSSRLEQIQLREQLRMQYECSAHLAIINDLESHVESLEKELEKQAEAYATNLETFIQAKVEQEQRAIKAEEELQKTRWNNAKTVEQLQEDFKQLSSQISTTFSANEELVKRTLEESRELRLEKYHMGELLEKKNEELLALQQQHQVKFQQLISLIDFKTEEVDRLLQELKDKKSELDSQKKAEEGRKEASSQEISMLKADLEQLSRDKSYLSAQMEEKVKLEGEIETLKKIMKETESLLKERNSESHMLGDELSMLKEEAKESLQQLNSLRNLRDEQVATIKSLNLKVRTLTTQNSDLEHRDELEKENLRKQSLLPGGDPGKEADINANLTVSEGTTVINVKSQGSFFSAHDNKTVAGFNENSKLSDANDTNDSMDDGNSHGVKDIRNHFQDEVVHDKTTARCGHESCCEETKSHLGVSTKTEAKTSVSCTYEQQKLADVLSDMEELRRQNESMEAELKEIQERYSDMSLRFAEVESERQQLVIRMRSLKNSLKN